MQHAQWKLIPGTMEKCIVEIQKIRCKCKSISIQVMSFLCIVILITEKRTLYEITYINIQHVYINTKNSKTITYIYKKNHVLSYIHNIYATNN